MADKESSAVETIAASNPAVPADQGSQLAKEATRTEEIATTSTTAATSADPAAVVEHPSAPNPTATLLVDVSGP